MLQLIINVATNYNAYCRYSIIIIGIFDFDICQYSCLVRNWKQQAEDCNVILPNLNTTIDTNLPIEEQWMVAVMLWTELHNAWASEASRRGVNIASSPELGTIQYNLACL